MNRMFLATLAVLLLMLGGAAAEPTATEQRIRELAGKKPGSSVVFMDVRLLEQGKETTCTQTSVNVVSDEGYSDSFSAGTHRAFWVARVLARPTGE